jgi:hypothetical protein
MNINIGPLPSKRLIGWAKQEMKGSPEIEIKTKNISGDEKLSPLERDLQENEEKNKLGREDSRCK